MRKRAASCLIALVCGCASGDDGGGEAPNDAGLSDDRTTVVDAPGQDAPGSADDSPSGADANIAADGGQNAEPDGDSWVAEPGADAAPSLDATMGGTTDAGPPDTGAVSSSDATTSAAPTTAPAAPTQPASNVISLFSATYIGGTANGDYSGHVDSYNATCFGPPGATLTNYAIAGTTPATTVLEYVLPASTFGIIELIGGAGGPAPAMCNGGTQGGVDEIDATAMTHFHMDVWSPQGSTTFQIHLVGADTTRTVAGPGAEIGATAGTDYGSPATDVAAGAWVSLDLPLSQFGPAGAPSLLSRLALVKLFSSSAGTFFVDNVYLYGP
jgi:hypothetical protein